MDMNTQNTLPNRMTDADFEALKARNNERLKVAVEKLGTKHLIHPANRVVRKTPVNNGALA